MIDSTKPYTFDRVVRMVLTAMVLVAAFSLLRYLSDVLLPFAAAVVMAYFLNPLVTEIENRTQRRGFAVAFTLTGVVVVGFALILLMALMSFQQVSQFQDQLGQFRRDTVAWFNSAEQTGIAATQPERAEAASKPSTDRSILGFTELRSGLAAYRDNAALPKTDRLDLIHQRVQGTAIGMVMDRAVAYVHTTDFTTLLVSLLRRVAVGGVTVINFAAELCVAAAALLVILLYVIFLLLGFPEYRKTWKSFLPPAYRQEIISFLEEFELVLRRYFRGQFLIASLTGILFALAFSLIGLPMAVPFGIFVGVLNMVPYLQTVALVPAAILAVFRAIGSDGSLLASFAWVGLAFILVQVLQDAVLTPRIMGSATGLNPVAILLGIFIWGKLLGFLGLLLAIPLTCLGIAYYRRLILKQTTQSPQLTTPPPSGNKT